MVLDIYNVEIFELLKEYKQSIFQLCENVSQKKFIEDMFSRWYFNAKKHDIFPIENIVLVKDLEYANMNRSTRFNVYNFLRISNKSFNNIYSKFLDLITNDNYKPTDKLGYSSYKFITPCQFGHLQDLYIGEPQDFYKYLDKLVYMYQFIGVNGMQLSIPPIYKGIELFGSPLNTHNNEYCSPFDIEKKFGSLGSFWEYYFHKSSLYLCNPPFDEVLINKMVDKLIKDIYDTKYSVVIIITIPIWDTNTQKNIGIQDYGLDLEGFTKLLKSPFLVEHKILNKEEYKYWNYYNEQSVAVCWSHLIVLSNIDNISYRRNYDIELFLKLWRNFIIENMIVK